MHNNFDPYRIRRERIGLKLDALCELTCPHFPHGNLTYPAAAVAVGKLETPSAFSKWAEPTSFP